MAAKVIMPQGGQDLTTGRIVRWLYKEGAPVKKGDVICEVETEKAVFEVSAPQSGVLLKILAGDGAEVEILSTIGYVGEPGEVVGGSTEAAVQAPTQEASQAHVNQPVAPSGQGDRRPKLMVSPKALRMAQEHNIPLGAITSSRPDGKIESADVLRAIAHNGAIPPAATETLRGRRVTLDRVRKTVGKRLVQSWTSAPHIFVSVAVDMSAAVRLRAKEAQPAFSFNDLVLRACALSLREFPEVNASLADEDTIQYWEDINIGVAVAAPQGLLVPVIEDADRLDLKTLAARTKTLAERAREGKMDIGKPSRFTVSNLGMHGVESFTAVINPPEAAILAVASIRKQPVVLDGDKLAIRDMMMITISLDHRVGDGVLAAKFANAIKDKLEAPEGLL